MQGLHRVTVLAIWLLCLLFNGAFSERIKIEIPQSDEEGTPVEVEMICHPGRECYPKVFVPTTTFVTVESDQVIPPGLHVRLNVGTGGREAKLIDPNEDEGTPVYVEKDKKVDIAAPVMEYSDLAIVPDEDIDEVSILNGGHDNSTNEQPRIQIIPEPETLKPNPHLSVTDWETFNNAVAVLEKKSSGTTELSEALTKLTDLSHEPEYGVKLVETALSRLIAILSSEEHTSSIRSSAAITLGNSLQNNAVALSKVRKSLGNNVKTVVIKPILDTLLKDNDIILERRLMFALSRTVRIKLGKEDFIALNGLDALKTVFTDTGDLALRGKIAAFLQDEFLDSDMVNMYVAGGSSGANSQRILKVNDELGGWCGILQKDLVERENVQDGGDLDSEAKVLVALEGIKKRYGDKCAAEKGLREWLDGESERMKGEEDADWIKVPLQNVQDEFF
ncbi:hypothetical protein ABW19_dt0210212 [Dactylella cylindrospora]|nr:hypothetical protein ABW19_dt0210212 [Dactylella cylindrospora]